MSGLSREEIERGLCALDVPPDKARAQALREHGQPSSAPAIVPQRVTHAPVSVAGDALGLFQRTGDALRLELRVAPRTKKNGRKGGFGGIKQGPAYKAYRDAIVAAIAPIKHVIGLPLPERPYNIAAVYYVDRYGKTADKCGLDQGLYDALENAGVVTNDWQFRTDDGTRIVAGDSHPRVELVITPIEEVQDGGQ